MYTGTSGIITTIPLNETTGSFNSINPSSTKITLSIKNLILICVLGGVGIIALGVLSTWGITKLVYKIKLNIYNSKVTAARREEDAEDYGTARTHSKSKTSAITDANGEEET